jgi:hypothetical protein
LQAFQHNATLRIGNALDGALTFGCLAPWIQNKHSHPPLARQHAATGLREADLFIGVFEALRVQRSCAFETLSLTNPFALDPRPSTRGYSGRIAHWIGGG